MKIKLNGEALECVSLARNLGVTMDINIRLTQHIKHCIHKVFSNLKLIREQKKS